MIFLYQILITPLEHRVMTLGLPLKMYLLANLQLIYKKISVLNILSRLNAVKVTVKVTWQSDRAHPDALHDNILLVQHTLYRVRFRLRLLTAIPYNLKIQKQ